MTFTSYFRLIINLIIYKVEADLHVPVGVVVVVSATAFPKT